MKETDNLTNSTSIVEANDHILWSSYELLRKGKNDLVTNHISHCQLKHLSCDWYYGPMMNFNIQHNCGALRALPERSGSKAEIIPPGRKCKHTLGSGCWTLV